MNVPRKVCGLVNDFVIGLAQAASRGTPAGVAAGAVGRKGKDRSRELSVRHVRKHASVDALQNVAPRGAQHQRLLIKLNLPLK